MPQMSPMPWMMIFMLSIFNLMMFSSLIYFTFTVKLTNPNNKNDNKFIFNIWSNSKL
uniref:ATP synthase F0 subunit 8 n=1 Tax=Colposcenia aliena TaxID=3101724 RepID=A0AAU8G6J2_9HEMI